MVTKLEQLKEWAKQNVTLIDLLPNNNGLQVTTRLIDVLEDEVDEKYYLSIAQTLQAGEVGAALSRNKLDDLKDGIGDTVVTLIILAQQHGMTLEECLQYAYDEIKGRKGRTINGTFIKESDLND